MNPKMRATSHRRVKRTSKLRRATVTTTDNNDYDFHPKMNGTGSCSSSAGTATTPKTMRDFFSPRKVAANTAATTTTTRNDTTGNGRDIDWSHTNISGYYSMISTPPSPSSSFYTSLSSSNHRRRTTTTNQLASTPPPPPTLSTDTPPSPSLPTNSPKQPPSNHTNQHHTTNTPPPPTRTMTTPQTSTSNSTHPTPLTPPSPTLHPHPPKTPPTTEAIHPLAMTTTPPTPSTTHSPIIAAERPVGNNRKRPRVEPLTAPTQEQLYLDFGQASFGLRTICPTCNSLYVHGVEEDEANHRRVCNDYAYGVVLAWSSTSSSSSSNSAWKNLRIVHRGSTRHRRSSEEESNGVVVVVEVRPEDPVPYRKKVLQVKGIVDREVGFVTPSSARVGPGETASLGGKTAFLYVEDKRIVGFCTVELISKGYALLNAPEEEDEEDGSARTTMAQGRTTLSPPPTNSSNDGGTPTTPDNNGDADHTTQKHYYRSTRATKAMMGVHQIWCHRLHRRKGIARTLVDMARDKLVYGMTVPFDLVAFSSPTVDGAAFARRYSETERPLVYDCR